MILWSGLAWAGNWQPDLAALDTYNQGITAYISGDFEFALTQARQVLAQDPDCGLARWLEASALFSQGQTDAAIISLNTALAEDPTRPELLITLSEIRFAKQEFESSVELAQLAIQLDPSRLAAWTALSRALLRLNRTAELASPSLTRLSPPDRTCLELFLATEQGQPLTQSALDTCPGTSLDQRVLRRHLSTHLRPPNLPLNLALTGDPARCIQQTTLLIQQNPDLTLAWIYRGICYSHLGNHAAAQSDLQQLFIATPWLETHIDHFSGILRPQDEQAFTQTLNYAGWLLVKTDLALGDSQAATSHQARLAAQSPTEEAGTLTAALLSTDPWPALVEAQTRWPESTLLLPTASLLLSRPHSTPPDTIAEQLRQHGTWKDRYNLAILAMEQKNPTGCLYDTTLKPDDPPEATPPMLTLAYLCAARAPDLTVLDRLWNLAIPESLDPTARLQHAYLLARAGRGREARQVWDSVCESSEAALMDSCRQVRSAIGEADRERK